MPDATNKYLDLAGLTYYHHKLVGYDEEGQHYNGLLEDLIYNFASSNIADEYDSTKTYPLSSAGGDYVTYEGQLYKIKSGQTATGTWDSSKWDAVQIMEQVADASAITSVTGTLHHIDANTVNKAVTIDLADNYGDYKNPYASKTKNYVLAAPAAADGAPEFRALDARDIPSLNYIPLSVITAPGDLIVGDANSDPSALNRGTDNQVLRMNGTSVQWESLGTAADKGVATSISSTSTDNDLATAKAVYTAIENLPEPMIFKGSVGTGGTIEWADLPAAAASNEGWTYKVITARSTDPVCKVGDTIISNGSVWVVIPSGDEPAGTVTSVAAANATNGGLTITGSPITSSGTITIGHTNVINSGTIGSSINTSGATLEVPYATYDNNGHITNKGNRTHTVNGLSNGTYTASLPAMTANDTIILENNLPTVEFSEDPYTGTVTTIKGMKVGSDQYNFYIPSATSITATSSLLQGTGGIGTVQYEPYASGNKAAGRLYSGTTSPSNTTRLNYDGYFYATKLYTATAPDASTPNYTPSEVVNLASTQTITGVKTFQAVPDFINGIKLTNGTYSVRVIGPSGLTANKTVYMPSNDGTLALDDDIAVKSVTDGIWDLDTSSAKVLTISPYSSQQTKLSFDTSTSNPTRTGSGNRLNLNGEFYASNVYVDSGDSSHTPTEVISSAKTQSISGVKTFNSNTNLPQFNYGAKFGQSLGSSNYYATLIGDNSVASNITITLPKQTGTLSRLQDIAAAFSTTVSYTPNQMVINNGVLYRCKTATTGSWDSSKWEPTTIQSAVATIPITNAEIENLFNGA